jgi:hypothetical protein
MKTKLTIALALAVLVGVAPLILAGCGREAAPQTEPSRGDGRVSAESPDESAAPVAASNGGGSSLILPGGPRVIQTASLRVSVRDGGFESAVSRARSLTAGLGGFVVSSSATQGRGGDLADGTLVLRIPVRRYAEAMSALARIGRVEAREETGQDVSEEFVDLEARARHLQAVETQLFELLRRARTVGSALAVQSHLNEVQLQLEQVRGRMRFLEDQVSFATISLALAERRSEARDAGGWAIVDAWRDGAHAFVFVAGRIFVVVAAIAPVGLLLAVAVLAARFARRRRLLRA